MKQIKYEISLLKFTSEDLTGLTTRVEELEITILDRLRQEYKTQKEALRLDKNTNLIIYQAMRLFCLDCNLVSFSEIELMEFEVNNEFA